MSSLLQCWMLTYFDSLGYFETFNTMLPLYDRELFDTYYAQQYTAEPPSGAAWDASINVILAIGGLIAEVHSHVEGRKPAEPFSFFQETPYSKYFRNAASRFLDLTFQEPSLLAVQAFCGMVRYCLVKSLELQLT